MNSGITGEQERVLRNMGDQSVTIQGITDHRRTERIWKYEIQNMKKYKGNTKENEETNEGTNGVTSICHGA